MKRILYILALALSIAACTEEIDKSNRYTFTGETVADYMLNRSDKYSHFINLLKRANLLGLLSTYGQYTLFLPDNDAVEKFIAEKDSIYHATKDSDNPVWTGIISPLFEDLTDSMANAIARMHLIENNYHTADFREGAIDKWNFNDRMLTINYKVTDERFYIMFNNDAAIIDGDNQVENGIIHLIDKPINTKSPSVAAQIAEHEFFSIFSKAIEETGFESKVLDMMDFSYTEYISSDSRLQKYVPKKKYIKYTAFVEPDEVFHKNGIYTLADLKAFAEKWYGTEDKDNPRSPKNALNKFIAYHFVEGELPYNMIVPSESGYKEGIYNYIFVPGHDLYNYFPTMMGKLMKVLKPLSTTEAQNIYINYNKRDLPYNFEMRNHLDVRIMELTEFTQADEQYADFVPTAGNGLIHPIDKILIYNEDEMAGNILNERMRFDIAALQPELSSNNLWQGSSYTYFPIEYCKGLKRYGQENLLHSRIDYGHNGDIFVFMNQYDVAIKIPPVPSKTYEIRFSITLPQNKQIDETSFFQLYFDDKICGLPICTDIMSTDERIGWVRDDETLDNGVENDKLLRNKGWMKAPDTYNTHIYSQGYVDGLARDDHGSMRKIALIEHLVEGEHWMRFRYIGEEHLNPIYGGHKEHWFDYIELVPLHIISDPINPEDRH